jgi:peroxiredoxin family protein
LTFWGLTGITNIQNTNIKKTKTKTKKQKNKKKKQKNKTIKKLIHFLYNTYSSKRTNRRAGAR